MRSIICPSRRHLIGLLWKNLREQERRSNYRRRHAILSV
jgi:hypothetical protein